MAKKPFPGLEGHKLQKEDDEAFHVSPPSGAPFKVAKKGLKHSTVQRIQQHFADGGPVQTDGSGAPAPFLAGLGQLGEAIGSTSGAGTSSGPAATSDYFPAFSDSPQGPTAVGSRGAPEVPTADTSGPDILGQIVGAGTAAPAPVTPVPDAKLPGLPGADPAIKSAEALNEQGIDLQARTTAALDKQKADFIGKQIVAQQDAENQRAAALKAKNDQVDKLQADIMAHPVNPNAYWQNKTTGQHVMAGIGILLGGLSNGLIKQGNPALQIIEKAIDRDIDSQKDNLNSKNNQIRQLMEQGHDINSAAAIVKADAINIAAAQTSRAAAQLGNPAAIAAAEQLKAAARTSTSQQYDASEQRRIAITNERANFQQQQLQQATIAKLKASGVNPLIIAKELDYAQHPEKRAEESVNVTSREPVLNKNGVPDVDKAGNPLTVTKQTQRYGLDKDAAKSAREELLLNNGLENSARVLSDFAKKNPNGGVPGSPDVARAQAALGYVKTATEANMTGMKRAASGETVQQLSPLFRDPTETFSNHEKTKATIELLNKMIREHKQGILDAYTVPDR